MSKILSREEFKRCIAALFSDGSTDKRIRDAAHKIIDSHEELRARTSDEAVEALKLVSRNLHSFLDHNSDPPNGFKGTLEQIDAALREMGVE